MNLLKKKLGSRGFTLVEVLIATAVLGGVSVVMSQLITNLTRSQRSVTLGGETDDLKNLVRLKLQSESSCNGMMLGMVVPGANSTQGNIQLNDFFGIGKPLANGMTYGNLTVTQMQFVRGGDAPDSVFDAAGNPSYRAIMNLQFTITKPAGQSTGSQVSVASLPMSVTYPKSGPAKVSSCSSTLSASSLCADLGGVYDLTHAPHCYFTSLTVFNPADSTKDIKIGAGEVCLPGTVPASPAGGCRSTWPAYQDIPISINMVNNGGGSAPCHSGCGNNAIEVSQWVGSCGARTCATLGYKTGAVNEWDCSKSINDPTSAVVRCFR